MSDYTIINFSEVEDSSSGTSGEEAKFSRKHIGSRDLGVSRFRYDPNVRSQGAHSHKEQEEAYVVTRGSGRILLDGQAIDLKQWDVVRVAPSVVRAFEGGPEGLEILAVGGPKPEGGDGVRAQANWPT